MDEIGFENTEKIKIISSESEKWKFIYDTAESYGFEGIHLTPSLYSKEFGLNIENTPEYFQDFKLTLHFGGTDNITCAQSYEMYSYALEKAIETAAKHNMHDISIHPPNIYELPLAKIKTCYELFRKIIEKWLAVTIKNGISLTLETHVSGKYFLFDGLENFIKFTDSYPELGILIDVSHNYYDGYSEDEIIGCFADKNVKGLHISDALQGVDFNQGTHLAIGKGTIDFSKIIKHFNHIPNLYSALEIKANNKEVANSLEIVVAALVG